VVLALMLFLIVHVHLNRKRSKPPVGLHLGHRDEAWWQCLPFVALTTLLLALPALVVASVGKRAGVILPKVSGWMTHHAWVVSEVVCVFFAAITIHSLVSGS
jgi:hypothetical protein